MMATAVAFAALLIWFARVLGGGVGVRDGLARRFGLVPRRHDHLLSRRHRHLPVESVHGDKGPALHRDTAYYPSGDRDVTDAFAARAAAYLRPGS